MSTPPLLLAKDQHAKEEDPEDAHGVPVPGGTVHHHLAQLDTAQKDERQHRTRQRQHADEQVETMSAGDQIEKVATGGGGKENVLFDQLFPGNPLAGQK